MPPTSHIGQNIKRLRLRAKRTQLSVAHAIGLTGPDAGSYLSRVETGAQQPRVSTLNRIAKALRCHLGELVGK